MKIDVYSDMPSAFNVQLKDCDISTRKYNRITSCWRTWRFVAQFEKPIELHQTLQQPLTCCAWLT
jgi:hypothetical protein